MENYESLSDMNDLSNSFKFNNNHSFDGFNKQEQKKEEEHEEDSQQDESNNNTAENPIKLDGINPRERKVLTNWLDAEYTSAFQYKKINLNYSPYATSSIKKEVDINDPIVIYEYLKKYMNVLYDYDCDKDTEKVITDTLEKELKDYYLKNYDNGLEKHLDEIFKGLKEKYLLQIQKEQIPAEKINKMLFIK